MAKLELQIFGDESTAKDLVTYGLVCFVDRNHERRGLYAWNDVIKRYGANSRTKVHAREIFSGQAREKTEWAHLSESESSKLAVDLMRALKSEEAFFALGVVHVKTWDEKIDYENSKYVPMSDPLAYGWGFIMATIAVRSENGVMKDEVPYKLFVDPLSNSVKVFKDSKTVKVIKMMETFSRLKISTYSVKPQLLDAADLFSYAAGRAFSDGSERNKNTCKEIIDIVGGTKTDFWWNPENQIDPEIAKKLGIKP